MLSILFVTHDGQPSDAFVHCSSFLLPLPSQISYSQCPPPALCSCSLDGGHSQRLLPFQSALIIVVVSSFLTNEVNMPRRQPPSSSSNDCDRSGIESCFDTEDEQEEIDANTNSTDVDTERDISIVDRRREQRLFAKILPQSREGVQQIRV